ncbi:MAG: class I SAM-dependent methyltransferase [Pyrinomonadaceae bacterium]
MARQNFLDQVNQSAYARADVVSHYESLDMLLEPERVLLERLTPSIRDKKILDIAFGGGRTTKYLLRISRDYTGVDYTPELVAAARRKFPGVELLCRDARDLSSFADATFDFVMFSFNSIDYVPHGDRLRALAEILRVLKPGGRFLFSTHNRDHADFNRLPWQGRLSLDPVFVKSCLHALFHLPRHLRMRRHEIHADEYAVINDNAHGFSLLAYYISVPRQLAQLARVGFASAEAFDMEGHAVARDTRFPWIHYLATKGGDGGEG